MTSARISTCFPAIMISPRDNTFLPICLRHTPVDTGSTWGPLKSFCTQVPPVSSSGGITAWKGWKLTPRWGRNMGEIGNTWRYKGMSFIYASWHLNDIVICKNLPHRFNHAHELNAWCVPIYYKWVPVSFHSPYASTNQYFCSSEGYETIAPYAESPCEWPVSSSAYVDQTAV
jgi:hypothetical protein